MRINHNIAALNTYRQLSANSASGQKSLEKLSSGLRINKAGDDAAGLAISEKMRAQIRGLDQASRNAQDGISMIQTAEGALTETHSILQRMRELAVQSANDTNVAVDRSEIQKEIDELAKELTRVANSTEFNTQKLINGGKIDGNVGSVKFHVGANAAQDITLSINAMDAKSLGVSRDIVSSATGESSAANIGGVAFSGELGTGIVDGAILSFAYTPAVDAYAGVKSENLAANDFTSATLAGLDNSATMTITVGTTDYTLDAAVLKLWDNAAGHQTGNDAIAFLGDAEAAGGAKLSSVVDITFDGNKLNIAAKTPGDTAITVEYDSTVPLDETTLAGVFGFTDGQVRTVDGEDVVTAQSATVEITSDKGHAQTVNVIGTAKTFSVATGNFKGMTLSLAADVETDLDGAATVTISATSVVAAAAQFSNGELIDEAVAGAGIDVSTQANASGAITTIQNAIETVSAERSKLGAFQNRLEHTINNLGTTSENLTASESRVRDVDMAKEMMEFTKNNILTQAAQAMLAQANMAPQGVLQLLR